MSNSSLPDRASLEYLRKLAKERLQALRRADPRAQLASGLLAVARDHGFASWRALKAEVEARQTKRVAQFVTACENNDVADVRAQLEGDPRLARESDATRPHAGWTALHTAAHRGHVGVVRLLLAHGADPNAREAGDNTYPLHWAAANRHIEIVRMLLDAGGDVHGIADVHELDAIGWATYFHPPGGGYGDSPEVASLLVERGARHHVFSAIALGDRELLRSLVEQTPALLDRRMSRFEQGQTPLHAAINQRRPELLDVLIEVGADVEASDFNGRTALAVAMLRDDREAMRLLHAAGAKAPAAIPASDRHSGMQALAASITKVVPMISVPDIGATLDWYISIGFKELGRYEDGGTVNWGMLAFGGAELMFNVGAARHPRDAGIWFYTDRIDDLYQLLKARQLDAARATLAGESSPSSRIEFDEDLYEPFYGGRQFSIRDPNGYSLLFLQPA